MHQLFKIGFLDINMQFNIGFFSSNVQIAMAKIRLAKLGGKTFCLERS